MVDENEEWTTAVNMITKQEAYVRDPKRAMAYRHVIMNLPADKIKNKVVLDLSKKSGHYAAFAARAGASKCYIMESSEKEANETKTILSANGFEGKCEVQFCISVDQLEISEGCVDLIIHEAMGDCLYVMSGLRDVIQARDKFLKRNEHGFQGIILPNEVSLYMVGIESEELRQNSIDFWCRKIEGLTFKCLREEALSEPIVDYIKPDDIVTRETFLRRFNLYNAKMKSLLIDNGTAIYEAQRSCNLTGFVAFFKCDFGHLSRPDEPKMGLSSSPLNRQVTGWKHCIFPINNVVPIQGREELHDSLHARFKLFSKNQDMAIDFHANLEIWYSYKDRKTARKVDLHEERTYTFYDFKDE